MIKATLKKDGPSTTLCVEGHAEYEKQGKDIVCAAVSSLIIALTHRLSDEKSTKSELQNGYFKISSSYHEAINYILFVFEGIELIAELYPNNVSTSKR